MEEKEDIEALHGLGGSQLQLPSLVDEEEEEERVVGESEEEVEGRGRDDDIEEVEQPKPLKKQCLLFVEEHFDALPSLACLPGVVAQQVLEYMMKRRKAGSRTLNTTNITKFLQHGGMQEIDLNSFWLTAESFLRLDCPHLLHLNLIGALHIGDEGVRGIARGCPQLRHLNVKGNKLSDVALLELAEHCTKLEILYVQSAYAGGGANRKKKDQSQPSSHTPDHSSLPQITDEGIAAIATRCKQLKLLSVSKAAHVTDEAVRVLAQKSEHLESLSFSGCSVTLDALTILSCAPPTYSPQTFPYPFPSDFVPAICSNLQRLKFNFEPVSGVKPTSPKALIPCYLPSLRAIKIYKHPTLGDLPFLQLPRQREEHRTIIDDTDSGTLSTDFPRPVTSPPVLFHPLPSLESIYLDTLPKLIDAAIRARLLPFSAQLRVLKLRRLTKVTGYTLEQLLDAHRHAERVQYCATTWGELWSGATSAEPKSEESIKGRERIAEEDEAEQDSGRSAYQPQLRSLVIEQCQAVNTLHITLPSSLRNLEISCIYWHAAPLALFSPIDSSLRGGVAYPYLRRVNLSMTYITDGTLQALAQLCPHVQELNIAECHQFREQGLAHLFPSSEPRVLSAQPAFVPLSSFLTPSSSSTESLPAPSPGVVTDHEEAPPPQLRLRSLNLNKCMRLKLLAIRSAHLTALDLSWCQISDMTNARLPNLKTLDVSGAELLNGFFVFLAHSPRLRSLWAMAPCALDSTEALDRLTGIDDDDDDDDDDGASSSPSSSRQHRRRTLLPRLRVLNVVGMSRLAPRHVEAVLAGCPRLRTLHLYMCRGLTKPIVDAWEASHPRVLFKGWERVSRTTSSSTSSTPDAAPQEKDRT